jgi:hypothetical protein
MIPFIFTDHVAGGVNMPEQETGPEQLKRKEYSVYL